MGEKLQKVASRIPALHRRCSVLNASTTPFEGRVRNFATVTWRPGGGFACSDRHASASAQSKAEKF
jgi:hypothetical protein